MWKANEILGGTIEIKKAFLGLVRRIQTTVEHIRVTNDAKEVIHRGQLVTFNSGGSRAVTLSDEGTNDFPHAVACEDIADPGNGIARYQGDSYVRTVAVPTVPLAVGIPLYTSNTAGFADTDVNNGNFLGIISEVLSATEVMCVVNKCCDASIVAPG